MSFWSQKLKAMVNTSWSRLNWELFVPSHQPRTRKSYTMYHPSCTVNSAILFYFFCYNFKTKPIRFNGVVDEHHLVFL